MKKIHLFVLLLAVAAAGCTKKKEFTVLQWNIWQEGTMVSGGYDAVVNEIARLSPDFVTFSEVRNYKNTRFCRRIVDSLKEKGLTYYSFYSYDSGVLSKHPITDSLTIFPCVDDHGSIYKMTSSVHGRKVAVYTAHLDYLDCAYYNVRGYDGSTWKQIPKADDVDEILRRNTASKRDDAIEIFLKEAKKDIADGYSVIIGGDFNEPSHLDWIDENKNMYDHNGLVIPWTVTTLLEKEGFVDSYRRVYPDAAAYPGFTYPSDNADVDVKRLTWAPESDERERIDYIFYHPSGKLDACKAVIFGPRKSIACSQRIEDEGSDTFLLPESVWPTDHKGVLVTFRFE